MLKSFTYKSVNILVSVLILVSIFGISTRLLLQKILAEEVVFLSPGMNINNEIQKYGPGTTYLFKPGIYRMQKITHADNGDQFNGIVVDGNGPVLNGSRILSGWKETSIGDRKVWFLDNQKQKPSIYPKTDPWIGFQICDKSHPRCRYNNELFSNNERRKHVSTLDSVNSKQWYFDFKNDRIYIGENPRNKVIELSMTDYAFDVSTDKTGIGIRNLRVEKYATRAQDAAISLRGSNSVIEFNYVLNNHSSGISIGHLNKDSLNNITYPYPEINATIRNNVVKYNGFSGFGAAGKGIILENNEISYNNQARFYFYWDGGGGKIVYADGVSIKNNYSHHNYGNGFWTDLSVINVVYENNISTDNAKHCIQHEISYKAVIRNNYVGNCQQHQIYISNSKNVEVTSNVVVLKGDQNGIIVENKKRKEKPIFTPHVVENVIVTYNSIYNRNNLGRMAGLTGPSITTTPKGHSPYNFEFASTSTIFDYNKYYNSSSSSPRWTWGGWWTDMSFDCFRKQNKSCSSSNTIRMEANGIIKTSGYSIPTTPIFNIFRGPQ